MIYNSFNTNHAPHMDSKNKKQPPSDGEYNTKDICVPKGKTRTNNVFTPIWHTKARKTLRMGFTNGILEETSTPFFKECWHGVIISTS